MSHKLELTDFKVLSFDCYGTLIDWASGIADALDGWLDENELEITRDEIIRDYVVCEAEVQAGDPTLPYPEVLKRTHAGLGEKWQITSRAGHQEVFAASVGTWPPFEDTFGALQYLKRNFRLVILSNIDRASFMQTNQRLAVAFDAVLTAEEIGDYKPSLVNFRALIERIREWELEPKDLLHVAGSVFHDIEPAHEIGLATCWIDRMGERDEDALPPFDFYASSLEALASMHRRAVSQAP